jgi:hypothetical protein
MGLPPSAGALHETVAVPSPGTTSGACGRAGTVPAADAGVTGESHATVVATATSTIASFRTIGSPADDPLPAGSPTLPLRSEPCPGSAIGQEGDVSADASGSYGGRWAAFRGPR